MAGPPLLVANFYSLNGFLMAIAFILSRILGKYSRDVENHESAEKHKNFHRSIFICYKSCTSNMLKSPGGMSKMSMFLILLFIRGWIIFV